LGIGDWAQSPIPNPQSPIPNPQFIKTFQLAYLILKIKKLKIKRSLIINKRINEDKNGKIQINI
jgi:hypothetical protein